MRRNKQIILSLLALILPSCTSAKPSSSPISPTSSSDSTLSNSLVSNPSISSPSSSSSATSSTSSVDKPLHVTITLDKEDLLLFDGNEFYGTMGKLTFQDESFTIQQDQISTSYSYYQSETNKNSPIIYAFHEKSEYRLSLMDVSSLSADEDSNDYLLILEEKEGKDYTPIASFMPAVSSLSGYYTATGDGDIYNVGIAFDGTYDTNKNGFLVSYGNANSGHYDETYRLISYYSLVKDTFTLQIDLADSDDYGYLGSHTVTKSQDRIVLGSEEYITEAGFLRGKYFSKDSGEVTFTMNETATTLSYGTHSNLPLTGHVDDKGSYYTYTLASVEYTLRPTPYGFIRSSSSGNEEFVYEEKRQLAGTYTYQNKTYTYSYTENDDGTITESLKLDDKAVDYTLDVYQHHLAFKVIDDNDTYLFTSNYYGRNLLVSYNGKEVYFINSTLYASLFARTYYAKTTTEEKTFTIGEDFSVTYNGKNVKGYLTYNGRQAYVTLYFAVDGNDYSLDVFYLNNLIFVLRQGETETYCFDKDVITSFYGEYTSDGSKNLLLSSTKLTKGSTVYDYELAPLYDSSNFSYLITARVKTDETASTSFVLNGASDIFEMTANSLITYIPYNQYERLLGTYVFQGTYGLERFYVQPGKFYADSVSNGALEKKVEYPFTLRMNINSSGEKEPVILFNPSGSTYIYCYLQGGSLVTFGNKYVREEIYDVNGVYVDSSTSTIYYLHDDVLEVNGSKVSVTDYTILENGQVQLKTATTTYTFALTGTTATASNGTLSLTRTDVDYASFVKAYTITIDDVTYSLEFLEKVDSMSGHITYVGKVGTQEYAYTWVIKDGKVAMKFAVGMESYYLSLESDGTLILSHESSLIPPPPPLP